MCPVLIETNEMLNFRMTFFREGGKKEIEGRVRGGRKG